MDKEYVFKIDEGLYADFSKAVEQSYSSMDYAIEKLLRFYINKVNTESRDGVEGCFEDICYQLEDAIEDIRHLSDIMLFENGDSYNEEDDDDDELDDIDYLATEEGEEGIPF
jgi:hypothetical protein